MHPSSTDSPDALKSLGPGRRRFTGLAITDGALLLLIVLLAGMVAAFASRNSDQWLHFAAGRDLLAGSYSLGHDPYSYAAAERGWVNPSWLYDVGVYGLYSADATGRTVVLAKAVCFAVAVFIAVLIRLPGTPRWPAWLVAAIAVIAAAPHTQLRPCIVSALILAMFLWILLKSTWRQGSWKNPLLLALLCTLWANIDEWFFLGPTMVGLVLLAELIQQRFASPVAENDKEQAKKLASEMIRQRFDLPAAGDDMQLAEKLVGEVRQPRFDLPTAARAPRPADLAKALILCLLATMANPHAFHVWRLPFELTPGRPAAITDDPQLMLLSLSPLNRVYFQRPELGWNMNGLAFGLLLILGGGLLALGQRQVRFSWLLLWMLLAGLALYHYRLILFFALAAIPLTGMPLAAIADRWSNWRHGLFLSPLARTLGLACLLGLLLCAWPGWLHPKPGEPAYANRVDPRVEPDLGHVRVAQLLHARRTDGRLPATVQGAASSMELANHMAWFTPGVRVFLNSRYAHHLPELERFLAVRAVLEGEDASAAGQAIRDLQATYFIVSSRSGMLVNLPIAMQLTAPGGGYRLWHLDGRSVIFGELDAAVLSFNPVVQAFVPDQAPLPEPVVVPPPLPREAFDDFFSSPRPVPLSSLDAQAYQSLAGFLLLSELYRHHVVLEASTALTGPGVLIAMPPPRASDAAVAMNLLAQRHARIAMAENPDHPQAYFTLAHALSTRDYPLPGTNEDDTLLPRVANMRRFLDRMPPPRELRRLKEAQQCAFAANTLQEYYQQVGMFDLACEAQRTRIEYQKIALASATLEADQLKATVEGLNRELAEVNERYSKLLNDFQAELAGAPANVRLAQAFQRKLAGEALKILRTIDLDQAYGVHARGVELQGVALRLQAGLLEEAVQSLNTLDQRLKSPVSDPQQQAINDQVRQEMLLLYRSIAGLSGNFAAVREQFSTATPDSLPDDQRERLRAALTSVETLQLWLGGNLEGALGGALASGLGQVRARETLTNWQSQADRQRRIGLTWLFDGRMDQAKVCFERALNPQGIAMPGFFNEAGIAQQYLRMIEAGARSLR